MGNDRFTRMYVTSRFLIFFWGTLRFLAATALTAFIVMKYQEFGKTALMVALAGVSILLGGLVFFALNSSFAKARTKKPFALSHDFITLLSAFEVALKRKYPIEIMLLDADRQDAAIAVVNQRKTDILLVGKKVEASGFIRCNAIIPVLAHELGHLKHNAVIPPAVKLAYYSSLNSFRESTMVALLFVDWRISLFLFAATQVQRFIQAREAQSGEVFADLVSSQWTTPLRLAAALEVYNDSVTPKDKPNAGHLSTFLFGSHPYFPARLNRIRSWQGKFAHHDILPEWGVSVEEYNVTWHGKQRLDSAVQNLAKSIVDSLGLKR